MWIKQLGTLSRIPLHRRNMLMPGYSKGLNSLLLQQRPICINFLKEQSSRLSLSISSIPPDQSDSTWNSTFNVFVALLNCKPWSCSFHNIPEVASPPRWFGGAAGNSDLFSTRPLCLFFFPTLWSFSNLLHKFVWRLLYVVILKRQIWT